MREVETTILAGWAGGESGCQAPRKRGGPCVSWAGDEIDANAPCIREVGARFALSPCVRVVRLDVCKYRRQKKPGQDGPGATTTRGEW